MYKPLFNKRRVLVFHQFQNKGWSLFSCLGREVVCSVLSVSTLTYASAESISTKPVVTDSTAVTTAREMLLDEVSVTGSRAPLTRSQAARMVTVLERADIQQAPVQSINDLLKLAVGVDVRQRSPIGAQTDISIRGGTQEQIVVLLNGINICDPQTAHNTLDLPCDLSDIQRIEVLEGPAARIYGTSSLVGAINIVTKGGERSEVRGESSEVRGKRNLDAHVEAGSHGYAQVAARYSLTSHPSPLTSTLSASYTRSDGYSHAANGSLNSDYSGAKAFYQGAYTADGISANWHVGIADKGWGSSTSYASPKWQADDQYEHTTKLTAALQSTIQRGAVSLHPSLYWNQHQDRYEGYRNDPEKLPYNYNRTDVCGLQLNAHFDSPLGRTAIGAELRNENLVSTNLGEPLSRPHPIHGTDRDYTLGLNRTNISAYAEHNLLLRNLTVSAGFVVVKNTWADMNPTVYPGIDATLRLGTHWQLHANYNTSLRMPSFTEMYYRLQGYAADPHLKPEEMHAVELGTTFHSSFFTYNFSLWHHHGRNMIDWIMDTRQGDAAEWQSVNHTRLNSLGLEASAKFSILNSQFSISYSHIHQKKDLEPALISQYALEYLRHKLVANIHIPLLRLSASPRLPSTSPRLSSASPRQSASPRLLSVFPRLLSAVLRRCRSQAPSLLALDATLRFQDRAGQYTDFDGTVNDYRPFALVDARLSWQHPLYELHLKVNNLLNTRYRDYGLVPQPGRWLIIGITIHL